MFNRNFLRLIMAVLFLMAIVLACDLTDTTVECNVPDLIDAINQANFNSSPSTIDLSEGCIYTLTAVDNEAISTFESSTFDYGDNGLPQIATPITINGHNATIIRDSGAPHFRIFFIIETGSLTINDLTLDNGFADGSYPGGGSMFPGSGGAIYNDGSTLEVNNCMLQNNQATFYGGAIFGDRIANTSVSESIIQDNIAAHGGGLSVYHSGLLSIDGSEISNNTATTQGGGMSLGSSAELTIHNSLINSNHSARHGGGIFKDGSADSLPTTIHGTTFEENTADWSGGGVFIWSTPLTISDSRFINNYANEYGGGLGFQSWFSETVTISKSTFEGNSTKWDGGAIHFSGELMNINGSTIQNNFAENGAGIHNGEADDPKYIIRADSTLIVTGSRFQENTATGNGGGAYNEGVMSCGESDFMGNESHSLGGGIHNTGELEVNGCTFDNNTTGFDGGGISSYSIAEIRGSDFINNTSTRGGGFASIGGDAVIRDSSFVNNSSLESGGAIFNMGATLGTSPMEIENCEISNNSALTGGGIATSMGETGIVECTLSGNVANNDGGGIYNGGLMTVIRSTLSWNETSGSGGGIWNNETINVQESTLSRNNARQGGGLASGKGKTTLTNNTFSTNTASNAGGGLFISSLAEETSPAGSMEASHITIAFNSAPAGGGITISSGSLKIKNSILAKNTPGTDCDISAGGLSSLGENMDSDGSCTGFTQTDDAMLDVLANYGGPTETHALKTGSPAIDAAPDCTTTGGSALTADQRGEPRPGGSVCDLGAYEDKMGKPTPTLPYVVFKQPLDCRLEPSSSSIAITSFRQNDSTEVVGRNINLTWYQVAPEGLEQLCWVWVRGVDFFGDLNRVEIIPSKPSEYEEEEEQQLKPSQLGCTVWNPNKVLICQVPCPPNAVPGDPCTP